ncbi:hypothetical protein [Pseudomonas protegens]|uniref:hypothetical protein n=1 Tax=Pseudomonas protegens TaxID=380021 RepID=UPI003906A980
MFQLDPLCGDEPLTSGGTIKEENFVKSFWGWNNSALHNPMVRGYFAEFLIYRSLLKMDGQRFQVPISHFATRIESDVHDLVFFLDDVKYTIQVKSKDSYSQDPFFKTSLVQGFNYATNTPIKTPSHWSDFYVFAYLQLDEVLCDLVKGFHFEWNKSLVTQTEKNKQIFKQCQDEIVRSVLELDNWRFYIVEQAHLDLKSGISLAQLTTSVSEGKAYVCNYERLPYMLMRMAFLKRARALSC